jgi:PBP1b-binding outer membrane lipoprotein LpoB
MKYWKEISIALILALAINGCTSRKKEQITTSYKRNFCGWAVPFYSVKEPFDETASDAIIAIIYRHDIEYDCVCNNKPSPECTK